MDDFGEFYAARKDAVYRALLVATRGQPGAEDAVAEAFTRAYARWEAVGAHPNPTAWVLRTALNEQRTWWRRLRRELLGDPPDVGGVADRDPGGLDARLRALVMALPTRQRQVVALRLLADLSAEETGRTLRIGAATVHVHLHRALATLRAQLAVAVGDGSLVGEER
ncbi:sigma-70 family RNA polymerase sigma factor [Catellatospora chokoriensis]|uniref:RNA polymerase sigma24 factor n=1 Tax=Catellatospora chokoriensis TaxID=310353 RepID=A0A8J3K2A2_9ACTN|nr:sigma-70 family RNA polymerase sigma factor [Catellatospora chokoriensis]GIF88159.1 RNA polymerase sigma24 factor [Catellatospora chokoriensis]